MDADRAMIRSSRRRGFTLVEVLVAVVILAIGATGLVQLLALAGQQSDRHRGREAARRIAENEVQRARGAGPWNVQVEATPARVDRTGAPDPAGPFRIEVRRETVCDPAAARPDDAGTADPSCAGAVARVRVTVDQFVAEEWTPRVRRVLLESGGDPGNGSWTPGGDR